MPSSTTSARRSAPRVSSGSGRSFRPIQAAAAGYNALSSGRQTALALVLAIAFTQLVLSHTAQNVWSAIWSPSQPLNQNAASSSQSTGKK